MTHVYFSYKLVEKRSLHAMFNIQIHLQCPEYGKIGVHHFNITPLNDLFKHIVPKIHLSV